MTSDEVLALIKSITYKPNFEIRATIRSDMLNALYISVCMHVPNILKPEVLVPIGNTFMIPSMEFAVMEKDVIIHQFFDFLLAMEEHEANEWFKVDGKQLKDPHYIA